LNPNLTEQQRALQMQQLQSQFNQSLSGTLNDTFNNPQMLSRYNQLNRSSWDSTRSMTPPFGSS